MPTPAYYKDEYFPKQLGEIVDDASLKSVLAWADENYAKDDTDTRFRVAYSYLAAATRISDQAWPNQDLERASHLFHFAGHHLRKVESWKNSALAYEKAGDASMLAGDFKWAIRSYMRAKQSLIDVGDAEDAARLYVKEQDARRQAARPRGSFITYLSLSIWRATSKYGQSWGRWLVSVVVLILAFSLAYEYVHRTMSIDFGTTQWAPILSGIYVAVQIVTTLGIGDGFAENLAVQTIVVLNVIFGWLLLGIGAGIVARRVKER